MRGVVNEGFYCITLSANSRATNSVECSVRNPYWSYKCFCVLKKLSNWEYNIFQ